MAVIDVLLGDQLGSLIFSKWSLPRDYQWNDRRPLKAWLRSTSLKAPHALVPAQKFLPRRAARLAPAPRARNLAVAATFSNLPTARP
jgi:hypothetical protein